MKKFLAYTLPITLIIAVILCGCGGGKGGTTYTPGQLSTCTVGGVAISLRYAPSASFTSADISSGGSEVTVTHGYWIAETEVTWELWTTVTTWGTADARGANKYIFANAGSAIDYRNPITEISWRDAMVWCNALSEMAGLTPAYKNGTTVIRDATNATICDSVSTPNASAKGFRLPTSNEWQLAARYQDGTNWTPGNHVSGDISSYCYPADAGTSTVFGNYAWYTDNSSGYTHEVAKDKMANALNLYDMCGNVQEWCFDWYPGYEGSLRITRGGCWNNPPFLLQLGFLVGGEPVYIAPTIGFRPVRTE